MPNLAPPAPSPFLAVVIPLLLALGTLIVAAASEARPNGDRLAVVFPPWWSSERALAAALPIAPVAGVGRLPFIVAVSSVDALTRARLSAAGAWATLDGARFAFCLSR